MSIQFEDDVAHAIFSTQEVDGTFIPEVADYLKEMGQTRPSIVMAFAPKAAGTYLRTAAIAAIGGQLVRTVQAQGGRDAQFYLPTFLFYYAGGVPSRPLVTHVHMQALPANTHFIEALNLRPVIMIRPLPDMLISYLDMLEGDSQSPGNWLNIQIPPGFADFSDATKCDFIIDMMAPWYASYFATWLDYAQRDARVLMLDYDEFRADPLHSLECLLLHSRFQVSREACQAALNAAWDDRRGLRFHKGVSGRGQSRFTPAQMARLRYQLEFYPQLAPWMDRLIPPLLASSSAYSSTAA
jgi:hypothetical protein